MGSGGSSTGGGQSYGDDNQRDGAPRPKRKSSKYPYGRNRDGSASSKSERANWNRLRKETGLGGENLYQHLIGQQQAYDPFAQMMAMMGGFGWLAIWQITWSNRLNFLCFPGCLNSGYLRLIIRVVTTTTQSIMVILR